MKHEIAPFVKWVGGKRQLIEEIKKRMPDTFNQYFEPFVGGGALFMNIQPSHCFINDMNTELITTYYIVKEKVNELMALLDEYEKRHKLNPEDFYYQTRQRDRSETWHSISDLEKAARFIYLNKACFNGMYRVNAKGYFNVPFGKKEVINTYSKDNLIQLSQYLNQENMNINNGDFSDILIHAQKGDFIFFDPPYDLIKKDSFVSYTKDGFGEDGQKRLAKIAHELHRKGCYVMITNHNTPLINELYKDFYIDVVNVKRMINSDASKRTGQEVIIHSYDIGKDNI